MAAHNPPLNNPPVLQIPGRPPPPNVLPPGAGVGGPNPPALVHPGNPPAVLPPDGNLGSNMDVTWFRVIVMRCTAGLHEGAASVTLDRVQGAWHFLPNEFVESALQASSRLPIQHLILKRHMLCALPANLASPSTLLPHSLTMLDLSFNSFDSLPPVVCQLVNLQKLFANNNNISELPVDLPNLTLLEELHLHHNQMTALPVSVCGVVSLTTLNLENNDITAVPSEISKLSVLRLLYLRSNELQFLPDSIQELSRLEELHLTCNALERLPNHLEGLSSLKQLHLAHNKLRSLPMSITYLQNLQVGAQLWPKYFACVVSFHANADVFSSHLYETVINL